MLIHVVTIIWPSKVRIVSSPTSLAHLHVKHYSTVTQTYDARVLFCRGQYSYFLVMLFPCLHNKKHCFHYMKTNTAAPTHTLLYCSTWMVALLTGRYYCGASVSSQSKHFQHASCSPLFSDRRTHSTNYAYYISY